MSGFQNNKVKLSEIILIFSACKVIRYPQSFNAEHPVSLSSPLPSLVPPPPPPLPSIHLISGSDCVIVLWLVGWPPQNGGARWWWVESRSFERIELGGSEGNKVGQSVVECSNPTWLHCGLHSVSVSLRIFHVPSEVPSTFKRVSFFIRFTVLQYSSI